MSKTFKIAGEDISDGYHTFGELYDHRNLLFINLCALMWSLDKESISWRPDYVGWLVIYAELPTGQISYHVPDKFRGLLEDKFPRASISDWDGHNSEDVIDRLTKAISE